MDQARIRVILAALGRPWAGPLRGRPGWMAGLAWGLGLTVLLMTMTLGAGVTSATAAVGEMPNGEASTPLLAPDVIPAAVAAPRQEAGPEPERCGPSPTPVARDALNRATRSATRPAWPGSPRERGAAQGARGAATPLVQRRQAWPDWSLPAPLARPERQAPRWPAWFLGEWQVDNLALPADGGVAPPPGEPWRARFVSDGRGGAVADRAFNAFSVGRSQLGARLLSVQDDPDNPLRQLARLTGDQLLETSLIGQRSENAQQVEFLNDELSLQVLHGPGAPRVSRIETLGHWRLQADGTITGEQWQARYASPGDGLAAAAQASDHWRLRLVPVPQGCGPARQTAEPAEDCR